jgi:hypothetical protein
MNIKQRADTVNRFFEDPSITVLLVSTKCGSLGLNLTVANRVILMDLWWNPAIENQAIDRVHRIGQAKAVDVHRLFINNSVEDRILALQEKKQVMVYSLVAYCVPTHFFNVRHWPIVFWVRVAREISLVLVSTSSCICSVVASCPNLAPITIIIVFGYWIKKKKMHANFFYFYFHHEEKKKYKVVNIPFFFFFFLFCSESCGQCYSDI